MGCSLVPIPSLIFKSWKPDIGCKSLLRPKLLFWYILKIGQKQLSTSWKISSSFLLPNEILWQIFPGVMQTYPRAAGFWVIPRGYFWTCTWRVQKLRGFLVIFQSHIYLFINIYFLLALNIYLFLYFDAQINLPVTQFSHMGWILNFVGKRILMTS